MGAVATKTETAVTLVPPMAGEVIDAKDILLPSLYLMQSNSEWVKTEKAKIGEIVKSTGTQVVAKKGTSLVILPLSFSKSFRIVEQKGNKWVRNEAFDPAKSDEWEFKENGLPLKRVACINVFAFLQSELDAQTKAMAEAAKSGEMMDASQAALPVLISFRSAGYRAGKEVVTHFALAQKCKSEPYMGKLELSAGEVTNDKGTFQVYSTKPFRDGKKLTPEALEECAQWRKLTLTNSVKVDDSGEGVAETESTDY